MPIVWASVSFHVDLFHGKRDIWSSSVESDAFLCSSKKISLSDRNKMQTYHLHYTEMDGVPFDTFLHFYNAMQTLGLGVEHFSTILYRFNDNVQTEYRLCHDPVHCTSPSRSPKHRYTCTTRPSIYVDVYAREAHTSIRWKDHHHGELVSTTLCEHWVYLHNTSIYTLTKSSTGSTKGEASMVRPVLNITVQSNTDSCVHDLMGRFRCGIPDPLVIQRACCLPEEILNVVG